MAPPAQLTIVVPTPIRPRAFLSRPGSPLGQKQLTARRGSVSAPDPHGTRSTPSARGQLSRLTIVRVPRPKAVVDAAVRSGRKRGRYSMGRTSSPTRLSFASASFSAPSSPTQPLRPVSPRPGSPSQINSVLAPRRPQSPLLNGRLARSNSTTSQHPPAGALRFSPTQVYDFAKVTSRPTANFSPTGYALPESFAELTDDVFLPFLDRPSEVRELIQSGSNSKLLVLFAHILPSSNEEFYPRTSAELAATVGSWCFEDFTTWLTHVSREEIDDVAWVRALRALVLPRSEVLWERLKGLLSVPPEHDVEVHSETTSHGFVTVTQPEEPALSIVQIRPTAVSTAHRLISEEDKATKSGAGDILGLRITTPIAFPPSAVKVVTSAPCTRTRTPNQSTIPIHSSPLVPKTPSPVRLDSAPASTVIKKKAINGESRHIVEVHSREMSRPLFPLSFNKLGCKPTLLSLR